MSWDRVEIARLLLEAGILARSKQRGIVYERKSDRSLVTEADRAVEAMLSNALEDVEAGKYIIGEETVFDRGEDYIASAMAAETFVIDPIDGTVPYAHQLPNWGVSLGRMVGGRLLDGAVFLPAIGEIVISDGDDVYEGVREVGDTDPGAWSWRKLDPPSSDREGDRLIAITQAVAKRGRVELPNPLMVVGAAVIPLVGLAQGRFAGYLGSVKLWDIAGALPLVLRQGFSVTVSPGGERREVTTEVNDATYQLGPESRNRWKLQTDLLVVHPHDEARFRAGFVYGEES